MTSDRPLIGLTGRRKNAGQLAGTPESLHSLTGDWFYAAYSNGVYEAGGLPVNLPLDIDPALYAERLDGILLSGGTDVASQQYGKETGAEDQPAEHERDEFELALLAAASERQLPVLGICRGLQLINVACGGTLHQHVPEHAGFDDPPETLLHEVTLEPDSLLGSLYGEHHAVNSLHHQTVDEVGESLRVTARDRADGQGVEGIEHRSLPIVAVQWHPEMLPTRASDPIFAWLVNESRKRLAHA